MENSENELQISDSRLLITKLTALWAVSESGLGGLLHAVKLPFSGLLLGSFAVIIITFIARNSVNRFSAIINVTVLVMIIKAIASPHSPFTAYVAVGFQGLAGAVIYSLMQPNRFSAPLFGVIALAESAFQKFLMLIILFGENIWTAFREFFVQLAKQLNIAAIEEFPVTFVALYATAYIVAGFFAGIYGLRIPEKIRKKAAELQAREMSYDKTDFSVKKKSQKKAIRLLMLAGILLFIVTVFLISGSFSKAWYAILRTAAAMFLIFAIINPLFRYLISKWKISAQNRKGNELSAVFQHIPQFRQNVTAAWNYSDGEKNRFRKLQNFLISWMALSLYSDQEKTDGKS